MTVDDEAQARRILEVGPAAPMEEVHRAYQLLKRIHGRDQGLFAAPGMAEFSAEARQAALEQIEAAYELLCAPGVEDRSVIPEVQPVPAEPPAGSTALARARRAAGFTLDQVAAETHVRREHLSALEEERFDQMRLATVNVRGYLTAFVTAIGLSADEVVPPYMERFRQWQSRRRA